MKKRPSNPAFSEEAAKALIYRCMVCHKACEGFYGAHESEGGIPKGTCSGACERIQQAKPKYPDHDEESFLQRIAEKMDHDH